MNSNIKLEYAFFLKNDVTIEGNIRSFIFIELFFLKNLFCLNSNLIKTTVCFLNRHKYLFI